MWQTRYDTSSVEDLVCHEFTKYVPYTALTGELCGLYRECFGENWRRYNHNRRYRGSKCYAMFEWMVWSAGMNLLILYSAKDSPVNATALK